MRLPLIYCCLLLFPGFMAGCAVGPNYHRPPINLPSSYRGNTDVSTNSLGDLAWWKMFHDSHLQNLIRTALTNNYDLRIAATHVEQARQMAIVARAGFFPEIDAKGVASKGKNAFTGTVTAPTGQTAAYYDLNASLSWELDLWGRIRRMNEDARAQYFATEEARRDTMTSLVAQVARGYFQLLAFDRELQIARDTTNSYAASLKIFNQRLQGGVASKLETASAEALLDSAAATIPDLERQIALEENILCVLTGQNPGPIARESSTLEEQSPPDVPAGLPSRLLERRPDVREAEQRLRSANAEVGIAVADFFPQISLTALLGQVSSSLTTFADGSSTAWSIAANVAGPIFHGGEFKARYRAVKAARDAAALQYQATVLNALQEVSNELIARQKYGEARAVQARAVEAYQVAVKIATERYRLGNASYYEILQEQQLLFPAENLLVQHQANQLIATVQLYRALGGGWQLESSSTMSQSRGTGPDSQ